MHITGAFKQKYVKQYAFRYLALAPVVGMILCASWLTHIVSSDEFYHNGVKNSQFHKYWAVVGGTLVYYIIHTFTYVVAEYKYIFERA